jgi:hypothetical protein
MLMNNSRCKENMGDAILGITITRGIALKVSIFGIK